MFFTLIEDSCFDALGMENGMIQDGQLSASSSVSSTYSAKEARLNGPRAWRFQMEMDKQEEVNTWIQVTFGQPTNIAGIATQGGGHQFPKDSWVAEYKVKYSWDASTWVMITDSYRSDVRMIKKRIKKINEVLFTMFTMRDIIL